MLLDSINMVNNPTKMFVYLWAVLLLFTTYSCAESVLSEDSIEALEREIVSLIKGKITEEGKQEKCKFPNPHDLSSNANEAPSSYEVNSCHEPNEKACEPFDYSQCVEHCVAGYEIDKNGCTLSCDCALEGTLESDIMLDKNDVALLTKMEKQGDIETRAASRFSRRWTTIPQSDGTYFVPYSLDDTIVQNPRAVLAIAQAIEQYKEHTCLRFRPRTNERDYIEFIAGRGCYSYIGRRGGKQPVSIGRGCEVPGIAMHEMMHAMGFWHEHSRPDRDSAVRILFENINPRYKRNFKKQLPYLVDSMGSPYDIGSIMQYGGTFFSTNGNPTIINLKTNKPVISQREAFTKEDIKQLNMMYKCKNYL